MIKLRKSEDRGYVDHGWLKAKHSFSFASYYDPKNMHFGPLRVINQDIIAAKSGFPQHPHDNMEIITYIIRGELSHQDSTGKSSTIFPGKIQRMSAGNGIVHSEFNNSDQETELLQIWLLPDRKGHTPGYEEVNFGQDNFLNQLQLIVSPQGIEGSLSINRDVLIYRSMVNESRHIIFEPQKKYQWLQLISGKLQVDDQELKDGDAIGLVDVKELKISAIKESHFLLFDMN